MKYFLVILFSFLFIGTGLAQDGVIQVYSGEKKNFTLFVDGLQENDAPKWKVKVKNLMPGPHHLRVLFENGQTNTIQKRMNLPAASELTFEILLYENHGRSWYELTQVDSVISPDKSQNKNVDSTQIKKLEEATIKVDSLVSVNIPKPKINAPEGVDSLSQQLDTISSDSVIAPSVFQCNNPIPPTAFDLVLKQLESEDYEDLLLDKAKELSAENCLSSIQIMEVMQLMEFEVTRLEFAIFSYPFCFDPKNYAFVEDAFEYNSSIEKLHEELYAKPGKKSVIK